MTEPLERIRRSARIAPGLFMLAVAAGCSDPQPEGPRVEGGPVAVSGAHEHGVARLSVTAEGSEVFLSLEAPSMTLFGFERAPRTDEERDLIAARSAALASGLASSIVFPDGITCAGAEASVTGIPGGEPSADEADDAHDHADDQRAQDGEPAVHMDVTAEVTVSCSGSPVGEEAALALMVLIPGLDEVDLIVLTEFGDAAARVGADASFVF